MSGHTINENILMVNFSQTTVASYIKFGDRICPTHLVLRDGLSNILAAGAHIGSGKGGAMGL